MNLTAGEIAEAVGGRLITGSPDKLIRNITTDSRVIKGDDLFIPIIGARVDGHDFIAKTMENGAAASFYSRKDMPQGLPKEAAVIRVDDTMAALQRLGEYYRTYYVHIPYVGITGSVGKTTVREMTATALSAGFKVYSTKGNANSQSGVPITVTETEPEAGIGVIEMGISEFGEMSKLSRIVRCDMAVVTVIGVSHIANLKSQENIRKEKLRIADGMKDGGILFLNGDDPLLRGMTPEALHGLGIAADRDINIVFYGCGDNADFRATDIGSDEGETTYTLKFKNKSLCRVRLKVPGMHAVLNSAAAVAVAVSNGVDAEKSAGALEGFEPLNGRGRTITVNGIKVINDAYNAAPQSMEAGLAVLDSIDCGKNGKRIAVLADMKELGENEAEYHREVGRYLANHTPHIDLVLLYGELAGYIADGINSEKKSDFTGDIRLFTEIDKLKSCIEAETQPGDVIFFKGSNSMRLWALADELYGA